MHSGHSPGTRRRKNFRPQMARSTAKSDEHRWELIQIIFYLCESDLAMYSSRYLWRK